MKKEVVKNVVIVILLLVIAGLVSLYFLNPRYTTESTNVLHSLCETQIKLSEYVGKMRADMFDSYSTEQILVGSYNLEDIENSIIMDATGEELTSIVYSTSDDIKTINDIKYYRVNVTNVMSVLETQLINDSNIIWYVSDTGVLKVSYNRKPDWWIDEFEVFHLN